MNKSQQYTKFHPNRLKVCEIIATEVVDFLHSCDLESMSWSIRLVSE